MRFHKDVSSFFSLFQIHQAIEQLATSYKKKEQEMLEFQRIHRIQVKGEPPVNDTKNEGKDRLSESTASGGGVLV
jgi:hypothetical protein